MSTNKNTPTSDFTGKKKQIKKRGFKLQREAKEWEADFLRKQKGSTDMTFRSMYEIYIEDMVLSGKLNDVLSGRLFYADFDFPQGYQSL